MKRIILYLVVLAAMVMVLSACSAETPDAESSATPKPDRVERSVQVVETGSGVTVMGASDWAEAHPDIYASYMSNADNDGMYSYVETYPMIAVLYEGMGFSFDYNSARGHLFSVDDLTATQRPHPLSNCFTCKTPEFTARVNELGDAAYAIPFEEMAANITQPISCYSCHANQPGELIVTHTYLADAMGPDLNTQDPVNLACAQCHVEYYFDPDSKAVTLPYENAAAMAPDAILETFNNLMVEGQPFADYTNPRSGVRQIKVQHPEFETYTGAGTVHGATYNCADCHMADLTNNDGKPYTSHKWISPLDNPALMEETCAQCHTDLTADVRAIQEKAHGRTLEIGLALEELTEALVTAVESGEYSEAELDAIRAVYRDAQFYWDFVFVENSDGAHNSKLTHQCLDKAETLLNEALSMLDV